MSNMASVHSYLIVCNFPGIYKYVSILSEVDGIDDNVNHAHHSHLIIIVLIVLVIIIISSRVDNSLYFETIIICVIICHL